MTAAAPTFDRAAFESALTTRRFGRTLIARAEVGSTNDAAWDALSMGAPDGAVVVADVQNAGRGRQGRAWHHAPGCGLALSLVAHPGCDRRPLGVISLAAGLALARALDRIGAAPELKWPNDLLLSGRKVSGILAESRPGPRGADAVVIGVGVNVLQSADDFAPEIAALATSLALAGVATTRERVAAEFLNAFEPLWAETQEGDRDAVLAAWSARASFWGRELAVATPAGEWRGVARALDRDRPRVLEHEDGTRRAGRAGDGAEPAAGRTSA